MSPPKKAQVKPAKGSAPKSQNTTGRIVNKTQPQTERQAPSNPNASNYNDELHDYLDSVKTPEQVKQQWGELQKARAAAEGAGDRLGIEAAKAASAGLQQKANGLGMSVNDLPTANTTPKAAMKMAEILAARSREEPGAKPFVAWASRFVGKRGVATAAPKPTPRTPSPAPAPAPPPASAAPKAAKGSQGAYSKARVKQEPHKDCGKKLPYNDRKSVKGTGLQKDHTPSAKALEKAAMTKMQPLIKAGDIDPDRAKAIARSVSSNAPTIAIPRDAHKEGNTYKGKNTPGRIDEDSRDLNGAAKRDTTKISESMANKKNGCSDAYNKAAKELAEMDWNKYVDDMISKGLKGN